ncbi:MAG: hypothetical protein QOJ64_4281 [Acidobacteriota bacterium]|jgi:hypothetical protein|nr:hypothetical protein [Acidobacteriota bacterium]
MHAVKLKAISEDGGSEEIVDLVFDDRELAALKMYLENFERFKAARLIQNGIPELKKISMVRETGLSFEFTQFDYNDVYELLHLARPIFLGREPASFEKTCAILGRRGKGTVVSQHLRNLRGLYEKGEYRTIFQVQIGSTPLFHEKTLRDWLYGVEYHQDLDKRERIKELENALGQESLKGVFVSQLSGRIKATIMVADLVYLIVNRPTPNN